MKIKELQDRIQGKFIELKRNKLLYIGYVSEVKSGHPYCEVVMVWNKLYWAGNSDTTYVVVNRNYIEYLTFSDFDKVKILNASEFDAKCKHVLNLLGNSINNKNNK